jgi:hypothetical protein
LSDEEMKHLSLFNVCVPRWRGIKEEDDSRNTNHIIASEFILSEAEGKQSLAK